MGISQQIQQQQVTLTSKFINKKIKFHVSFIMVLLEIPFGYCKGHPNLLSQIAIHLNLDFLQEHTQEPDFELT